MAFAGVFVHRDPFVRLRLRGRTGGGLFGKGLLGAILVALQLVSIPAHAGNVSLTLTGSLLFPDESPDLVPVIGPQPISLDVKAVGRRNIPWTLTLVANGDFQSGPDTIPITNVSWSAFPSPPYNGGTLSITTPVLVASGFTHEHTVVNFDFYMQNSWAYNAGNYTATATFTLAAP